MRGTRWLLCLSSARRGSTQASGSPPGNGMLVPGEMPSPVLCSTSCSSQPSPGRQSPEEEDCSGSAASCLLEMHQEWKNVKIR